MLSRAADDDSVPSLHPEALLRRLCLPSFDFIKIDIEATEMDNAMVLAATSPASHFALSRNPCDLWNELVAYSWTAIGAQLLFQAPIVPKDCVMDTSATSTAADRQSGRLSHQYLPLVDPAELDRIFAALEFIRFQTKQ